MTTGCYFSANRTLSSPREEQKLTEDYFELGTGKLFCDAKMATVSKTESLLRSSLAVHIEGVRIRKHILVPISRLCGRDNTLAGFYKLKTECDIYQ